MNEWISLYACLGLIVFVVLAYGMDCERPPAGWWCDRSYLLASLVVVLLWPAIVYVWIRRQLR